MHELSLADSMVRGLVEYAEKEKIKKIVKVTVAVGRLSGVEKEPFAFAFPVVTEGTILENAELVIEEKDAIISCNDCGKETTLKVPFVRCSQCKSGNVRFIQGKEMKITSIEADGI